MPLTGPKLENFNDLSGTYSFADTTVKVKNEVYYSADYYKDSYKEKDSMTLISGIVYLEGKQMGYKGHLRSYYNISKVDTARVIVTHKKAQKSIENNYLIFDKDFSEILIDLNKKDELKLLKGRYYASKFKQKDKWEVFQLSLAEETLYINFINFEEKKKLEQYTLSDNIVHMEDDVFFNFINDGGFRGRIKFKKHGPTH
jgi:hypothetical protein